MCHLLALWLTLKSFQNSSSDMSSENCVTLGSKVLCWGPVINPSCSFPPESLPSPPISTGGFLSTFGCFQMNLALSGCLATFKDKNLYSALAAEFLGVLLFQLLGGSLNKEEVRVPDWTDPSTVATLALGNGVIFASLGAHT